MTLVLESPTVLRLPPGCQEKLRSTLSYHDLRAEYEYKKHKDSNYFVMKYGQEAWQEKLDELKVLRHKTMLFEDAAGPWTYSGLKQLVSYQLSDPDVQIAYQLPEMRTAPWKDLGPPKTPREYQLAAAKALLEAMPGGPAAVEMGTGLGKGFIIAMLLREIGLPAVVMAPSVSIFNQLRSDLEDCFGKKLVGGFGDGKKDLSKRFVVAIAASLTRVKKGSAEWAELARRQVFIADESHLCPASTLASVCFGLMANASWRAFFSGTQLRNDGLDKLLVGITGPVVYNMSVKVGVEQGWLAKPTFTMFTASTSSTRSYRDPNEETRQHLYYNSSVAATAGDIANRFVSNLKRPTLILIEEVEQFSYILPHLRHKVGFAHGGLNKENRDKVPGEYQQSDPTALVKAFNRGEIPILVGTSCIGTGTDIRSAEAIIYIQGGRSEIQVRQAVGRGTRGGRLVDVMNPWTGKRKEDCLVVDFDVQNSEVTSRHAKARKSIYEDIGGPVRVVER